MKTLTLIFLISIGFTAKATTFGDSIKVLDFKPYKINYPSTWQIKSGCVEKDCMIMAPTDTLLGIDRFTENIHFTYNALPSASYTADKYATFSIDYLPKVVKNFKVIERKKLKSNVIRLTYAGEKNAYQQTWRQYYYVKSSKVYIVTFSAETQKYDYYQPFIESYLNSFILK